MSDGDRTRLVAWAGELRRVHTRLRDVLDLTRDALDDGSPPSPICSVACRTRWTAQRRPRSWSVTSTASARSWRTTFATRSALLGVLETLALDADPDVLGPL